MFRAVSQSISCLAILLLGMAAPSLAAPGDPIGSAVSVVSLVTAKLEEDQRRLVIGDDVRQQELIEVDADGRSELILRDDTKLALGPGSRLLLDQFVYDPDVSGGAIVLDLVRGTFRFITGVAAKPAYVIRTPTASITVRGTIFDVFVQASGGAWILLIEGAIEVCTESNQCRVHDEAGKLIRIGNDSQKVDEPVKWAALSDKDDVPFDTAFPFIAAAPGFDPNPKFTRDDIVDDKGNDGGRKVEEPKPKKKKVYKKPRKKKVRKAQKKRKSNNADAKNVIKGLNVIIGIGAGIGGGKKRGGGGGHRGGGNYR
jgi:FecR-like protein